MVYRAILGLVLVAFISNASNGQQAPAESLSVMSFNMWHKDRPRELQVMVKQLHQDNGSKLPDFVLCQEVVFNRGGKQPDTAAVLARLMGYHSMGTKRNGDKEGIGIVSRYPFVHYEALRLKAQTTKLLLGFNRVSVMGEFMVPGVGRVRVVNVHLTNWGFEHRIREKQIRETLEWVAKREKQAPAAMTFLGGDFNAKRHWDEMKLLDRAWGNLKFADFNSAVPSMGLPGDPNKRIDYVFVSAPKGGVAMTREKLFWRNGLKNGSSTFYLSDHLLVMHEYAIGSAVAARNTAEPTKTR